MISSKSYFLDCVHSKGKKWQWKNLWDFCREKIEKDFVRYGFHVFGKRRKSLTNILCFLAMSYNCDKLPSSLFFLSLRQASTLPSSLVLFLSLSIDSCSILILNCSCRSQDLKMQKSKTCWYFDFKSIFAYNRWFHCCFNQFCHYHIDYDDKLGTDFLIHYHLIII